MLQSGAHSSLASDTWATIITGLLGLWASFSESAPAILQLLTCISLVLLIIRNSLAIKRGKP